MTIKEQFDNLLLPKSEDDIVELDAKLMAMEYLGTIDERMRDLGMKKKDLAEKVGTSASYITQLFMGDRLPNWKLLAKMQKALDLKFKVVTEEEFQGSIRTEVFDFYRKWSSTHQANNTSQKDDLNYQSNTPMYVQNEKIDFALAS